MISSECNIEKFFQEIRGKQKLDAIYMANREVTMAERLMLSKKCTADGDTLSQPDCGDYSKSLKEFIRHIRYSVKPKIFDQTKRRLFLSYLESIADSPKDNIRPIK